MPPRNRQQLAMWVARRFRPVLSERLFRSLYGYGRLGYVPDYARPRTFNEKVVAWLQRTRDPRLAERANKLAVREFVAKTAPWIQLTDVYAHSDDAATFPFDRLPDVSVFKANHGWNQHRILTRPFDADAARRVGAEWLAARFQPVEWERHYLDIPPRLFAEEYLGEGHPPVDYKVFVLNGVACFIQVFVGRGVRLRRVTFDRSWNVLPVYLPLSRGGPPDVVEEALHPPKPSGLEAMLRAAEALAEDLPFVRADFYVVRDRIYFGELTFAPAAGYVPFVPVAFDREFGDLLDIG